MCKIAGMAGMMNHLRSFSGTSDRSEGQEQGKGAVGGHGSKHASDLILESRYGESQIA